MAATTLGAGDIAIIGYNSGMSDGTGRPPTEDKLSFVLLKAVESGTSIFLTDRAWNGTAFTGAGGDGTFTYTAGSNLPAGTVISLTQAQLSGAGFDLNHTTGDAIYVYQGSDANTPTRFLHAAELADGNTTFSGSLANTGLTAGSTALAINFDSAAYNGPTTHAESFLWNGSGSTLLHSIADSTNWVGDDQDGQNSKEQEIQTGPWLTHADVEFWGTLGAGGLVNTLRDATHQSGNDDFNHTRQYDGLVNGQQVFWFARDMVFDTVDGKFFIVDSDGSNHRILQGNISDLVANPTSVPAMTVLYQDPGNTLANNLFTIDVDTVNNTIYFVHGDKLEKAGYNTANQTPTTLFQANVTAAASPSGFANPAGSTNNFFNDMTIDFDSGKIYLSSTRVVSSSGGDQLTKNFVYELSGLTTSSGTNAFQFNGTNTGTARLLPFAENDANYNPTGATNSPFSSTQDPFAFPIERGSLDGLAIDPVNDILYFSTGEIIFDHDGTSATAPQYHGGVVASYALTGNPTGAINVLYQQTAQFGGAIPGLMGDLEVDLVNGHWYVLDYAGINGVNDDNHWYRGNLNGSGTPIQFTQTIGDLEGAATVGLTLNHAPTLLASALSATATETSGPGSGESNAPLLFNGVAISDPDTSTPDEITGAVMRISDGLQTGAGHQDLLEINGLTTGTIAGSGINFNYNQSTGAMVLIGAATVAEYKAAIELVTFSTSGDNPTNYGTAGSRTIAVSVSDGLTMSDEQNTTVTVVGINDAPVNTVGAAGSATEDGSAFALTGIAVSDVDADPASQNITVTLSVQHGTITLRTDVGGGVTGANVTGGAGAAVGATSITITGTQNQINTTLAAVAGGNGLTYAPTADFNGADGLLIVTNDQGFGGTDPGLTGTGTSEQDSDTKTINVAAVNDAPTVSSDGTQAAATIPEDQPNGGETVSSLFGGQFSDALDAQQNGGNPTGSSANTLAAIAVVANGSSAAEGYWQYFDGAAWVNIGAASAASAQLITAATSIRFAPGADFNGTAPTLSAHLVDSSGAAITNGQTVNLSGGGATGGTTRFTSGTVVLSQDVTAVNDAPNVIGATETLTPAIAEDASDPAGASVSTLFASHFSDADDDVGASSADAFAGVAVVGSAATASEGAWQYFDGTDWQSLQGASAGAAILLAPDALVRFLPAANFNGPAPALSLRLVDDSAGAITTGGTVDLGAAGTGDPTRFSAGTSALGQDVTAVDDPAVAADDALTTAENAILTGVAASVFADNGSGADDDLDGDGFFVVSVNGIAADVDDQIQLASGALLTLNADGTFSYDPNGAFDSLAAAGSGASNTTFLDSFTYEITGGDTATATVTVTGVDSDDLALGTAGADTIDAGTGNDTLIGRASGDTLIGGDGTDLASYSDSNARVNVSLLTGFAAGGHAAGDTFSGIEGFVGSGFADILNGDSGGNQLDGGAGDDTLRGRAGGDAMIGGFGTDTVSYSDSNAGVNVSLGTGFVAGGHAVGDTFSGIENFDGSRFRDILNGNGVVNRLDGGGGNDTLRGRTGGDALIGGSGNDTASYSDSPTGVNVSLQSGFVAGRHAVGDTFSSIENLSGSAHDDILNGDGGVNALAGNDGADTLRGNAGADRLVGGNGLDTLIGGAGGDTLVFLDTADSDITAATADRVQGFASGDTIDVSVIDADAGVGGNQAFVLDTDASFSAGEIRQSVQGGDLFVEFNVNGDAAAEMAILLQGRTALLGIGDFLP